MKTDVYVENTNRQKKRTEIIILSAILAVIIIIGASVGAYFIFNGAPTKGNEYSRYLDIANKYISDGNYQEAVINYKKAIESDLTKEEAYICLGNVYEAMAEPVSAIDIYSIGYRFTRSNRLAELASNLSIVVYGYDTTGVKNNEASVNEISLNKSFINRLNNYTFENFNSDYGEPSITNLSDKCVVACNNGNITLYYYNTVSDGEALDPLTNTPKTTRKPNEISFSTLSYIFTGMQDTISYTTLTDIGLEGLTKYYDKALGKDIISFELEGCKILIECDTDGNIGLFSWNRLYPNLLAVKVEDEEDVFSVSGKIINAVTGKEIKDAIVTIYSENDIYEAVNDCTTGSNGEYMLDELKEGNYIIRVTADGFIEEEFKVIVNSWENLESTDLTISPELRVGEIRIVLTWNENPRDLDSYLDGTSSTGDSIHVNYINPVANDSRGNTIATLDVDDRDGNGPETTTIYDVGGDYTFTVRDYTHSGTMATMGATVKVYFGNSAPEIFEVPSDVVNDWEVFRIHNGSLEVINSPTY